MPLIAIGLMLFVYIAWDKGQASYATDGDALVYGRVKQGVLEVKVRGTGYLVPLDVRWIAARVEGRVEQLLIKPGTSVEAGDLILELSNPELVQLLEETRWEMEALDAETTAQQVTLQSQLLDQKTVVLNAQLDYESAKLQLDAEAQLIGGDKAAVSRLDYERSKLRTRQYQQRWEIEQQRYEKMEENHQAQTHALQARLNKMQKTVQKVEQQVDSLMVRASMDSVIQEIPLQLGEQVLPGANMVKLARQDELIAELQIQEAQIRDVSIGQPVLIDTRNNTVNGVVTRVDPAVIGGTVQVDVAFVDPLPADARPDLSVDGEIQVSHIEDTLYVSRPLFSQSHSQTAVYRLTQDGDYAERVQVRLGSGSVNEIEVLQGLQAGDQIILSDSSSWESHDLISIN